MKLFTMTKTVTKNLVKGPATLMYPQRERIFPPKTRGQIDNKIEVCIFCGLCARRCPTYALAVTKASKEWEIDRLKCCMCHLCVEICPVDSLFMTNHYPPPVTDRGSALHKVCAPSGEASSVSPTP
jgi:formate hydrogenlyase subunit 6/NADH:ubiquinone oxidoreductase subunit I